MKHLLPTIFMGISLLGSAQINIREALRHHDESTHIHNKQCGTVHLLSELENQRGRINQEQGEIYFDRPTLESEETASSEYFDFHYTTVGNDAVDPTDNNDNGVPDYVELMAIIADEVFEISINQRGFSAPPSDADDPVDNGGSGKPDIYIFNDPEPTTYGSAAPRVFLGDNSETVLEEVNSMTSFMNMRNNYDNPIFTETATVEEVMKVTLAHELSHLIDFGYNQQLTFFFIEAKGAWEEQRVYPDLTDNFQYLSNYQSPDRALNWYFDDQDNYPEEGSRWYGGWLFMQFLTEKIDGADLIMKELLTKSVSYTKDDSFINELLEEDYGVSFTEMHTQFAIANALFTGSSDFAPYNYLRGNSYRNYFGQNNFSFGLDGGPLAVENTVLYDGTEAVGYSSENNGNEVLMRLSADYLYFVTDPSVPFQISLFADPKDDIEIVLIGLTIDGSNLYAVEMGNAAHQITVPDQGGFSSYIIAIIRNDPKVLGSEFAQYQLLIDEISNNTAPEIEDQTFMIDERSASQTTVGNVVASDIDGDNLAYGMAVRENDAFDITEDGTLYVNNASLLNYDQNPTFDITVGVTDGSVISYADITISLNDVLSVSDEISTIMYPNPSEGRLLIKSENFIERLEVVDLLGKIIPVHLPEHSKTLELNLDPGLYFVQVNDETPQKVLVK